MKQIFDKRGKLIKRRPTPEPTPELTVVKSEPAKQKIKTCKKCGATRYTSDSGKYTYETAPPNRVMSTFNPPCDSGWHRWTLDGSR